MAEPMYSTGGAVAGAGDGRYQAVAVGSRPADARTSTPGARVRTGSADRIDPKALLAEFIGTLTLIFAGVGTIAVTASIGPLQSLVAVALAHGLALAVMITATAAISGGHLNPAVTLGALVTGRIGGRQAVGHWAAQIVGGIAGAGLIAACVPGVELAAAGYGTPAPGAGISVGAAFLLELVLTFFLVFVAIGTAMDARAPKVGGLFIGLAVTMDILVGGPISGAAMNPARFLGPAIVNATQLQYTWLYLIGPLLGGLLAGAVWRFWFVNREATAAA